MSRQARNCNFRCRGERTSAPIPTLAAMFDRRQALGRRLVNAADLAIDFATLGEYGLEPIPADGPRERPGHAPTSRRATGWEAFASARRGACRTRRSTRACA